MRVFNEQTQRLTRALGNMFLPILQKNLPYLNAFLMVLTEIVNWLATLFGYDEDMFSGFASGVGDITNDFIDLGNSLDNANKSAKKLKQGLRGFDKLNVITTPTSGVGNVGVGSGINPKIMEAFNKSMKEYENRLEKVQMKATKIRDNVMEWLGFTKEVDEETGKVSFKFDHITGGTVLGALAVGGIIFNGVKKIYNLFGGISKFFKGNNGIKATIDGAKTLANTKVGEGSILKLIGSKALNFVQIVGGIGLVTDGIGRLSNSIKNANEESSTLSAHLSFFETTLGGALIGSKFGIIGASIGGIIGAVTSTSYAVLKYIETAKDGVYNIKYISDETKKSYDKIKPSIEKAYKSISKLNTTLKIDSKTKDEIITNVTDLVKKIKMKVEESKNSTIENINEMVKKGYMTPDESKKAIKNTKTYYNNIAKENEIAQKRIEEIIKNASKNKRDITKEERDEINELYKQIEKNTVSTLSNMGGEQKAIYNDLKLTKTKLSKESASEVIKSALETRDKTIDAAESEYLGVVGNATKMKEAGIINEDTYNKIVDDAEKTKNETIKDANKQYDSIWNKFTSNQKDISDYIDKDTGNVKSNWETFWEKMKKIVTGINWKSIGGDILKALLTGITPKKNTFSIWSNAIPKAVISRFTPSLKSFKIPRFKTGIDFVPNDFYGPVYLDYGERVLTKEENQRYSSGENYNNNFVSSSSSGNKQPQVFNIYLDKDTKIASYVLDQLDDMASANGKPITIGG